MILRSAGFSYSILVNFLLMLTWYAICFFLCINAKDSWIVPCNKLYTPRAWENNGKWYSQKLKIKKWKDKLPQYVGKNKDDFSKKHLKMNDLSEKYIDDFIRETCRGEWDHCMNCGYILIAILINSFWIGILFAVLTMIVNLPYIAIQRYNRFRLQIVKKRILNRSIKTI